MKVERWSFILISFNKAAFIEYIFLVLNEKLVKIDSLKNIINSINIESWIINDSWMIDMNDLMQSIILNELNDIISMSQKSLWIFWIEKILLWVFIYTKNHLIFMIWYNSMLINDSITKVMSFFRELKTLIFKNWVKWDKYDDKIIRIILFFMQYIIHEIII